MPQAPRPRAISLALSETTSKRFAADPKNGQAIAGLARARAALK